MLRLLPFGFRTYPEDVSVQYAVPAATFWTSVPDQVTLPLPNVSVRTHGRGGSDAESGHKTYLSSALFVGSERIASALLRPASARPYAV